MALPKHEKRSHHYTELPPEDTTPSGKYSVKTFLKNLSIIAFIVIICGTQPLRRALPMLTAFNSTDSPDICPQTTAIIPIKHHGIWQRLGASYDAKDFKQTAADWLGGAVKVPTESYDMMGAVGEDSRWLPFGVLNDYLLAAFPLTHATLNLTKVNSYALLYEWKGRDASLKPLLLTAHQDVVPVDPTTVDQWTHPPYSGHFDSKNIWGRGSGDDKSGLIGIMISVESLLTEGYKPTRTIVLAFGIDEEATGHYGAEQLTQYMLSTYGEDAFSMLVDEGAGISNQFGAAFATPAIAEKGYLDVMVKVASPGGHSSRPPPHTSIGILSSLLVEIEKNPFPVKLVRTTTLYATLQCVAAYAPEMPASLRRIIKDSVKSDKALGRLEEILSGDAELRSLLTTTQAIDLVGGGVKTNALPEQAWAVINHRISTESSVSAVQEHDTAVVTELAAAFNLTLSAFGKSIHVGENDGPAYGSLVLSEAFNSSLEPAPVTPTGPDSEPYRLLSGTIKATYNAHRGFEQGVDDEVFVAPGMMGGNTDTQFYWNLTQHIFRYNHGSGSSGGIHTVNEFISVDSFVEMIRFFTTLILNVDESIAI